MERDHLLKEIHNLAERIKANASSNPEGLPADAARLYEIAILLKHLPEEGKDNGVSQRTEIDEAPEPKAAREDSPKESLRTFGEPEGKAKADKKSAETPDLFSAPESPKEKREKKAPGKPSGSVSEKLSHKKISDLKSAIGINERFQFINELFDGNMKEYTVALDQINNFSSLGEAVNYLANLKEMYKWAADSSIAANFEELVHRRFFQ